MKWHFSDLYHFVYSHLKYSFEPDGSWSTCNFNNSITIDHYCFYMHAWLLYGCSGDMMFIELYLVFVISLKSPPVSISAIISLWTKHIFSRHFESEGSITWCPKLYKCFPVEQGVFVPSFKSLSLLVSEIWEKQVFSANCELEGGTTLHLKFNQVVYGLTGAHVWSLVIVAQVLSTFLS